jgi:endoglucanase
MPLPTKPRRRAAKGFVLAVMLLLVACSSIATGAILRGAAKVHAHPHPRRHHHKHRHGSHGGKGTHGGGEKGGGKGKGKETKGVEGGSEGSPGSNPTDPFGNVGFFVEPNSSAVQTKQQWAQQGRTAEAEQMAKIASRPAAEWFGDWSHGHGGTQGDVASWVGQATASSKLPVIVAYDLPWRDCGQYSGGGAPSAAAYREFIDAMAAGIAGRRTVVILEPDALAELSCLDGEQQSTYYSLLSYAVATLSAQANVAVYLDAGHASWQSAATMAERLHQADVAGARGFSLNVSSFDATPSEISYGESIASRLGGSPHFIIDTSRNGRGAAPGGEWCNPPGRGLGAPPTADTGNSMVDAFFWVKDPGESDGACNGAPPAGQWWPAYALELANNAL